MSTDARAGARLRKQRQRERARERAREAALEQAKREEAAAEALAPAVMRNPVTTPEGTMLIGPRVQISNGRVVRSVSLADPIASSKSSVITTEHRRAARKLQLDWFDVGTGIGVGAVDYLRSGSGGGGTGGHDALLNQVHARGRLEGAMAHAGAFAPAIARVVLDGVPIAIWACEAGKEMLDALAWLALGLDRLVVFYDPPVEVRSVRIRAIGPTREAYVMNVEDVA